MYYVTCNSYVYNIYIFYIIITLNNKHIIDTFKIQMIFQLYSILN